MSSTSPYGYDHRQRRVKLLKRAYGSACPMCGLTMGRDQPLDLDHSTPVAVGGSGAGDRIVHASCNRSAGAHLRERLKAPALGSQDW